MERSSSQQTNNDQALKAICHHLRHRRQKPVFSVVVVVTILGRGRLVRLVRHRTPKHCANVNTIL